jgi:hypothetical protein
MLRAAAVGYIVQHICMDRLASWLYRRLFLDAALLLRCHPREHLLQAWVGILQQQEEENGVQRPSLQDKLRSDVEKLCDDCAGATLVTPDGDCYSR